MWIVWTLVSFAVLAWLGYAWLYALTHKYEHTAESRLILAGILLLSSYFGWRTVSAVAPGWSTLPQVLVSLLVAFAFFTGLSFLGISLWCALLTRDFDERMASLEEEQDALSRRMDAIRWQLARGEREEAPEIGSLGESERDTPQSGGPEETSNLEEFVESWQEGGGAARVRSLKVQEWREEISKLTLEEIQEEIQTLSSAVHGETDEIKREQGQVRLALLKLEVKARGSARSFERPLSGPRGVPAARKALVDEARIRERLQEIHREIQVVTAQKREFLRGRVRLSWRGRR